MGRRARGVLSEQISQANLQQGTYPAIYEYQPEEAEKGILANEALIDTWDGAKNGRITCTFGPHAPDTLTQEVLKEVKTKADERGVGIMIHIAQSPRELRARGNLPDDKEGEEKFWGSVPPTESPE